MKERKEGERERERERDRQRDRQTDRERQRQRQRDRDRDRQTDRQTDRDREGVWRIDLFTTVSKFLNHPHPNSPQTLVPMAWGMCVCVCVYMYEKESWTTYTCLRIGSHGKTPRRRKTARNSVFGPHTQRSGVAFPSGYPSLWAPWV